MACAMSRVNALANGAATDKITRNTCRMSTTTGLVVTLSTATVFNDGSAAPLSSPTQITIINQRFVGLIGLGTLVVNTLRCNGVNASSDGGEIRR